MEEVFFKLCRSKAIFILLFLLITRSLFAQEKSVSSTEVINFREKFLPVHTPVYKPSLTKFPILSGEYTYSIGWERIEAAKAVIRISKRGKFLYVEAEARTNSFIDFFYKLRYWAKAYIHLPNFLPIYLKSNKSEKRESVKTEYLLDKGGVIQSLVEKKQQRRVFNYKTGNATLDPYTAVLVARALPWRVGQTRAFDVFTGSSRYLVYLKAEKKIKAQVGNKERDLLVIVPFVRKLSPGSHKKKLKKAEIYITADKYHHILQIKSKVFIGSIYITLIGKK